MVEDVDVEQREALAFGVAEFLAVLSDASEAPPEFDPAGRALDPGAIDFGSGSWMSAITSVQGWLRLPDMLRLEDPDEFVEGLARGLGFDRPSEGLAGKPGSRQLSEVGLERLRARAERAVQLQREFLDDLEGDGGSMAAAAARWAESWDEEPEAEESTGPVNAKALTWNISDFASRATSGRLELSPSYQRGDVWPTADSQLLIESILRGIPLPSVIILKPQGDSGAPYEVVDGKQRLTAILRFIGQHPRALEIVHERDSSHPGEGLAKTFEENYPKFRRLWKNLEGEQVTASKEREYCFPFKLRADAPALTGELAALAGRYYTQIRDHVVHVADDSVEVHEIFERSIDYKIPVIEYSKATSRQIHEVFNLYNKQGKHLNAEEIRNAVYHELDFMRALMVVAGDNPNVTEVAPFLTQSWAELEEVPSLLADYEFGTGRYRRTKVLSWLASLLLVDSMEGDKAKKLSTARQIDALLQRIKDDTGDKLRSTSAITTAFRTLAQAIEAHSAVSEAWNPVFKDTKSGAKWQELQLVGSLLGVTVAACVVGEDIQDRLSTASQALYDATSTDAWKRPDKTQTGTQWEYIARISVWIMAALDVDPQAAHEVIADRFGYSGVATLTTIADDARGT